MRKLVHSIAILKMAISTKRVLCGLPKAKYVLKLVQCLRELGFINGYLVSFDTIVVHLRYHRSLVGLRKLNLFSKQTNKIHLKKRQILGRRVGSYYKSTGSILLSTSHNVSLLTDQECLILGIGGIPLIAVG